MRKLHVLILACLVHAPTLYAVEITIYPDEQRSTISPYIYGTNQDMEGDENVTLRRLGGNRLTGYNWENNASNAGEDWFNSSDSYLCGLYGIVGADCNIAGEVNKAFHDQSLSQEATSLVTIPMAGYVAADKNGEVFAAQAAPSPRWKRIIFKKPGGPGSFRYPPDDSDNDVFMDEFVNYMVSLYGGAAAANGIRFYSLDNEPDLWSGTHPRIHADKVGCNELVQKCTDLAKSVKDVDPQAEIFAPVFYGFYGMQTLQAAPDWDTEKNSRTPAYEWYVDYYLDKMRQQSESDGRRLIDVLDLHWYSEARGGDCRITMDSCDSSVNADARMQAPRSLWDPTYAEDSWIAQYNPEFLPLIPRIQQGIDNFYPGTRIAFTEHDHGGGDHYSGGIAMADVLGIFGKYGVYAATYWKINYGPYISSGFKLYRNYDGAESTFGDTKVRADTANVADMPVYASIFGNDDRELHIIAINRHMSGDLLADVTITGAVNYSSGEAWAFDRHSSAITSRTEPSLSENSFAYTIPSRSAFHFVLYADESSSNSPNEIPDGENRPSESADTSDGGGGSCFIAAAAMGWR